MYKDDSENFSLVAEAACEYGFIPYIDFLENYENGWDGPGQSINTYTLEHVCL